MNTNVLYAFHISDMFETLCPDFFILHGFILQLEEIRVSHHVKSMTC